MNIRRLLSNRSIGAATIAFFSFFGSADIRIEAQVLAPAPAPAQAPAQAPAPEVETVRVARKGTKMVQLPAYEGGVPRLSPITGTKLGYAVNSSSAVFKTDDDTWYACEAGVWFSSTNPSGPWQVAVALPPDFQRIPEGHPLHNVTYARLLEYDGSDVFFEVAPEYYPPAPAEVAPPPPTAQAAVPSAADFGVGSTSAYTTSGSSVNYTYTTVNYTTYVPWSGATWGIGTGAVILDSPFYWDRRAVLVNYPRHRVYSHRADVVIIGGRVRPMPLVYRNEVIVRYRPVVRPHVVLRPIVVRPAPRPVVVVRPRYECRPGVVRYTAPRRAPVVVDRR
ncbi:MAG: hypothetical protein LBV54_07735, partial [Puniceicoccales bacterium]|nr:hypothetical protein [Puniceicoccales bacterium]